MRIITPLLVFLLASIVRLANVKQNMDWLNFLSFILGNVGPLITMEGLVSMIK